MNENPIEGGAAIFPEESKGRQEEILAQASKQEVPEVPRELAEAIKGEMRELEPLIRGEKKEKKKGNFIRKAVAAFAGLTLCAALVAGSVEKAEARGAHGPQGRPVSHVLVVEKHYRAPHHGGHRHGPPGLLPFVAGVAFGAILKGIIEQPSPPPLQELQRMQMRAQEIQARENQIWRIDVRFQQIYQEELGVTNAFNEGRITPSELNNLSVKYSRERAWLTQERIRLISELNLIRGWGY